MGVGRGSWCAVVALVAVTACSGGGRSDPPSPAASGQSSASTPSPRSPSPQVSTSADDQASTQPPVASTCAVRKPATTGRSQSTVAVAGAPARGYVLYLPEGYDGGARLPVVFDFHGYGANADEQLFYSGMVALAERNRFVVVALNGQGDPPHYNPRPVARAGDASDIAVVLKLLDSLERTLCLDPKRVYATGMSDGGALSAALGCFASDRFAAVAPVAALVYDTACDKAAPVPLMAFRGTADEIVPYAGGRVACCGNPVVHSTKADIASWAKHNGCRPVPVVSRRGQVETSTYAGCAAGADVVLHSIIGGGHSWPGAIALPGLGVTTRDINASREMWAFFAAHPKP